MHLHAAVAIRKGQRPLRFNSTTDLGDGGADPGYGRGAQNPGPRLDHPQKARDCAVQLPKPDRTRLRMTAQT